MCWQFIQYIILTASEIALSITGLNFSYSEVCLMSISLAFESSFVRLFANRFPLIQTKAPVSMKSVVTAAWLFTTALGNFLVVVITGLARFDSPVIFDFNFKV